MTLVMASGGERHIQSSVLWAGFKPVTLAFAETTAVWGVHLYLPFDLWPVPVHVFLVALVIPNQMMRLNGLQRFMTYVMLYRKESHYGAKVVSAWCYSGVGQIPCREWTFQANWALVSKSDIRVKFVKINFWSVTSKTGKDWAVSSHQYQNLWSDCMRKWP
jgi:hypothetical protein